MRSLCGCAVDKGPQAKGRYTTIELGPDLFRVVYRGDGYPPAEELQDFALLGAAEAVRQRGFTWFALVHDESSPTIGATKSPGTALTSGSVETEASGAYFTGHTTYTPGKIYDRPTSGTSVLVRAYRSKPKEVFVYNAATTREEIRRKYNLK